MKKKIKKAFTLVELLVVIAILAILATVSIVGYNSFTKKAKVSNDTVLVKQMNDILFANSQTDDANPTMSKALEDVFDGGYDLTKLTPTTTDYNIMWDRAKDQMVLADENLNIVYPDASKVSEKTEDLFVVVKTADELSKRTNAGYSVYLHDDYEGTTITDLKTGIDTGKVTTVTSITYTGQTEAQKVVINTNGGKIIVNAPKDTVWHYGEAQNVNIQDVDLENSYHEYGNVGYLEIAKGHFVAEDNSKVIALVNTGAKNEVKLDKTSKAEVKVAYTENESSNGTGHGGNLELTHKTLTAEEKEELIYNAEAQSINAINVNGKYYKTMSDAFNRVSESGNNSVGYVFDKNVNIVLYKDIKDMGIQIKSSKNVVFDLNGHTYTVISSVGSNNTETNGFQLLKDSTVLFKNGTINLDKSNLQWNGNGKTVCRMFQCYAALTLEDMTIDGTYINGNYGYLLSFNNQPCNIIGNTNIILKNKNGIAFDADGAWGNYNEGVNTLVTVNTTGTIDGYIALGRGALKIEKVNCKGIKNDSSNSTDGRISISGGKFEEKPADTFIADGYHWDSTTNSVVSD